MDLTPLWLPLAVESSGINKQMATVGQQAKRSFSKATEGLGKGMADGVVQAAQQAQQATRQLDKITDAHEKKQRAAADAADRHKAALAKLADVQNNAKAKAGQLATAQTAVNVAQRKAEATAKDAARATEQQANAAKDAERATKQLAEAQQATANSAPASGGRAGAFFDAIRDKARRAVGDVDDLGEALEQAGSSAGSGAGESFLAGFGGGMASRMGEMGESSAGTFGGAMVGGVATRLAAASSKAGPWGMAIAGLALLGTGAGAAVFNQIMAGAQREASADVVQASIGVDDATMKRIGAAAANSYTDAWGESIEANMGSVKSAIQAGLIDKGASQGTMRDTINGLETIKTIMGAEVPEAARAAGQMMRTGMAKDADEAFDIIVKGTQMGLDKSGDWLDTLNEYSTQFRKLGIDGKQALGLVNQMVQGGARDSDVAADALKEFSIRVIDNSDLTKSALAELGLPMEETAKKFGMGGEQAAEALASITQGLQAIEDPVRRNLVGVALFGTQFEDLGDAASAMNLDTAVASLGKVDGAARDASNTIGGNLPTSWESFKRTFEVGLQSVQNNMAAAFGPQIAEWVDDFNSNKAGITGFFFDVGDAAVMMGAVVMKSLGLTLDGLGQLLGGLGNTYGFITDMGAKLQRLLGRDDIADQWEREADAGWALGEGMQEAGRRMVEAADGSGEFRENLRRQKAEMQANIEMTESLGGATAELRGADIVITDNSPEVLANIDETKWEITHLPTGEVKVEPKTEQATKEVKAWKDAQGVTPAEVPVKPVDANGKPVRDVKDLFPPGFFGGAPGGIPIMPPGSDPFALPGSPGGAAGGPAGGTGNPLQDLINSGGLPGGGMGPDGRPVPGQSFTAAAPGGGAEAWRSQVRAAIRRFGPQYGITNPQAWEDAMVRQIQSESGGNPGADNPNDSNGRGGKQHVRGLLQFLDSTYNANNITGRPAGDPLGQIAAFIPYVMNKYGVDASGAPNHVGRGVGYAGGGTLAPGNRDGQGVIHGPGTGTSDSIAGLVDGTRAVALSAKESINTAQSTRDNMPLINAMNRGFKAAAVMGFAGGGRLDPDAVGVNPAIQQVADLAAGMGLDLTSGMKGREGQNSMHASGDAGDFSNGSAPTDEMLAFATMMARTYGSQLDELIYDDPRWAHNIMDGKDVGAMDSPGGYTTAQAGDHSNHVHVGWKADAADAMALGNGQLNTNAYAGYGGAGAGSSSYDPFYGAGTTVAGPGGIAIPLTGEESAAYADEQQARADAIEAANERHADAIERAADAAESAAEAQEQYNEVINRKNDIVAGTLAATPEEIEAAKDALDSANEAAQDAQEAVDEAAEGISDAQADAGKPSSVLKGAYDSQKSKAKERTPPDANAQTLGGGLVTGAMEALGFDGSVFGDPTQWGIWKLFTGVTNHVMGGFQKLNEQMESGELPAAGGGGDPFSSALSGLLGGVGLTPPDGMGSTPVVSSGPGLSVPSAVSATAQPGSAVAPAAPNVPGSPSFTGPTGAPPGPQLVINGNVGQSPESVGAAIEQGKQRVDRQPRVGFPGGAPHP